MTWYLNTYTPLCWNRLGKAAAQKHAIPELVDGSCRREPDLEHKYPCISGLCRLNKFAPKLKRGDGVVYLTKKGKYGSSEKHWKLTAILKVLETFDTHEDAAGWYRKRGLRLPQNCCVRSNKALPVSRTHRINKCPSRWDAEYQKRKKQCGVMVACRIVFRHLKLNAPMITEAKMRRIMGRIPGTQNPPKITWKQYLRWTAEGSRFRRQGSDAGVHS